MSLTALSNRYSTFLDDWHHESLHRSLPWLRRQVIVRLAHPLALPLRLLTTSIDTALGVVGISLTIFTMGNNKKIYHFTKKQLDGSKFLLSGIFKTVISALNPHFLRWALQSDKMKNHKGIIPSFVHQKIKQPFKNCLQSRSFFTRHIITRILITVETVLKVIGRVIDLVVGILCGMGSLFATLIVCPFASIQVIQNVKEMTQLGFCGLQFFGVIGDLYQGMVKFLNPRIDDKQFEI